jgi:glycolate oxidase FAD binding subunit
VTLSVDMIAPSLLRILSPEQVVSPEAWPEVWQRQVKLACVDTPSRLVLPHTADELAAVVTLAHQQRWRMLIAGAGSKLSWGGLAQEIDLIVSIQKLDRLVDHAVGDMTVTVEAGMRFVTLQMLLAKHRQWLPLDPTYPDQATLGGILATRDAGSLRHRYGSLRDLCLGLSFVRSDGQIAKAGGRVVKNVAGYDLMKLFSGAYGTLGIATEMTLRTYPTLSDSKTVTVTGGAEPIAELTQELLQSTLTPAVIDVRIEQTENLTLLVQFQSLPESVAAQTAAVEALARSLSLSATATQSEQTIQDVMPDAMRCQVGVLSAQTVESLMAFRKIAADHALRMQGRIHAGSGLGVLYVSGPEAAARKVLMGWRSRCEESSGFLTVLEAPVSLKQSLDAWGYSGNALAAMRTLKEHFDPQGLLNPGRFVGGL